MFGDTQPDGRQLLHLAALAPDDLRPCSGFEGRLAGGADAGAVFDDLVRLGYEMQRLAGVTQLSARLLARLASQAPGPGQLPLEPVRGRRFAAVVAVLGQPRFQVAHPLHQPRNLLTLLDNFGLQGGDFFGWRHASMLHSLRKSA